MIAFRNGTRVNEARRRWKPVVEKLTLERDDRRRGVPWLAVPAVTGAARHFALRLARVATRQRHREVVHELTVPRSRLPTSSWPSRKACCSVTTSLRALALRDELHAGERHRYLLALPVHVVGVDQPALGHDVEVHALRSAIRNRPRTCRSAGRARRRARPSRAACSVHLSAGPLNQRALARQVRPGAVQRRGS